MPLWQSGQMDLGFARRQRARSGATDTASDLATLLSNISARQAVSRTAQVQASIGSAQFSGGATHPEVEAFAPSVGRNACKVGVSSFNQDVAAAILMTGKSL
jgi:hypothetical protein